jgi:hypothetical protein
MMLWSASFQSELAPPRLWSLRRPVVEVAAVVGEEEGQVPNVEPQHVLVDVPSELRLERHRRVRLRASASRRPAREIRPYKSVKVVRCRLAFEQFTESVGAQMHAQLMPVVGVCNEAAAAQEPQKVAQLVALEAPKPESAALQCGCMAAGAKPEVPEPSLQPLLILRREISRATRPGRG